MVLKKLTPKQLTLLTAPLSLLLWWLALGLSRVSTPSHLPSLENDHSSTAAKSEDCSVGPVILKPLPNPVTRTVITGSKSYPTVIYQIAGDRLQKRITIPAATKREIHFPPGQFFAETKQGRIAIPIITSRAHSASRQEPPLKITFPNHWPPKDPHWCWIPPGSAIIGDRTGIGPPDERPIRIKNFRGFFLGKTEVTNRQFALFLNQAKKFDPAWIDLRSRKCGIKRLEDGNFKALLPDHPVVMVSRYGADAYCKYLTKKTNTVHRLPTEWEWEKAAKGPENFVFSYGNMYQLEMANQESGQLKKVGCFQPNGFGLLDMTGNVFEWTSSRFNTRKNTDQFNQSLRGGSYVLDGTYLRNSFRMKQSPEVMTDDFGFRVLKEASNKDSGNQSKGKSNE